MHKLGTGLSVEDFQQISRHAEGAQQPYPAELDSYQRHRPPEQAQGHQPDPELKGIGDCSERADIPAPEAVDNESQQHYQAQGGQAHPEGDFTLEAGCNRIIRIYVLAEELAGGHCEIDHDKE